MDSRTAFTSERRASNLLGVLLASLASLLVFAGCGLSWSSGPHKTELFRKLTVTGDFYPGSALTLHLEYQQPYSVDVRAHCALLKVNANYTPTPRPPGSALTPTPVVIPRVHPTPSNTVYEILEDTLPYNPGPTAEPDKVTPVPGVIERQFNMPGQPGRYTVRCYTPLDVNNSITTSFTIKKRPS
jgi:hypothetical protein